MAGYASAARMVKPTGGRTLSPLRQEIAQLKLELAEARDQQSATADVLKVISRSAFDLQIVLQTLVESAARLIGADKGTIARKQGDAFYRESFYGFSDEFRQRIADIPIRPERGSASGRALLEGRTVHIVDVHADPEYDLLDRLQLDEFSAILGVPMMRNGEPIGIFALTRNEAKAFTDREIDLAATFADQAAIAIENVRLFEEVQRRTRDLEEALKQQTATADVLKAISRSAFDLEAVLDTLVASVCRLCDADIGAIRYLQGANYHPAATYGCQPEWRSHFAGYSTAPDRSSIFGRAIDEGRTVHVPDVLEDPEFGRPAAQKMMGLRAALGIPLTRERQVFGVVNLFRVTPRPFTEKQIALAQSFADQAVIAIKNVRLFEEVQARTGELAQSLDDLRIAQDRMIQTEKLASLGHLTAGIAHEIKNPLNFVNNFATLSGELTAELNEALSREPLSARTRAEIDEITGMLTGNLAKIAQHGRRADSIVRNMLLHSRAGLSERQPTDINALAEEALSLAYHGARAERPGFDVQIVRAFDPAVGTVAVHPQELTRVLLNLLSNAFHAVDKRRSESADARYVATVSVATARRDGFVDLRVRDNGPGIPPDVRERMFEPFFTTKPAGEGTGLGLSLSYDIVTKQHGGALVVGSTPEDHTEFVISLPTDARARPS